MNMNEMEKIRQLDFEKIPNQPMLIYTQRKKIIWMTVRQWAILWGAVLTSTGLFLFISIPLFVIFLYFYYLLSRFWRAYRYSIVLLHALTVFVWIMSMIAAPPIRKSILFIFSIIFH